MSVSPWARGFSPHAAIKFGEQHVPQVTSIRRSKTQNYYIRLRFSQQSSSSLSSSGSICVNRRGNPADRLWGPLAHTFHVHGNVALVLRTVKWFSFHSPYASCRDLCTQEPLPRATGQGERGEVLRPSGWASDPGPGGRGPQTSFPGRRL